MKRNKLKLYKDICLRFAKESHCVSKKVCCMAIRDGKNTAEEIFKPEIVAAFVLLKNSQTNIKEKT